MSIWILSADSGRARLFKTENSSTDLLEMQSLLNVWARLRDSEILTDGPGSQSSGVGFSRHGVSPKHRAKDIATHRFAKHIAEVLEQTNKAYSITKLYIIAAPEFLGELRPLLSHNLLEVLQQTYDRNVTTFNTKEIRAVLPRYL